MDSDKIIEEANNIIKKSEGETDFTEESIIFLEATEFIRIYAGEKSFFFRKLDSLKNKDNGSSFFRGQAVATLKSFIDFLERDLMEDVSIERKAQIDVVSDFLDQANKLLDYNKVHPAAPTVLIGAALEEFLRNWVEEADLGLNGRKPSLSSYADALKSENLITKQDLKDITSWGGLRNHAAHGEWDEVSDKSRINIMLEGVNLFMRRYGK